MKILVLNCGSSSIKYQLFNMAEETVIAKGIVQRIGIDGAFVEHKSSGEKITVEDTIPNHSKGIRMIMDLLLDDTQGVLKSVDEIKAVGHRVAHGGEHFPLSTLVDEEKLAQIEDLGRLAPLHNPHNATGIKEMQKLLPEVPQAAVFDTSFHQTMDPVAFVYPLPYELYQELGIRRYGFHGTSHKYVAQKAAKDMGRDMKELKIVTAHLGNGASITAVDKGVSVDTSMGFTPLEGLAMGTRCGDIDPAIVTFLQRNKGLDADGVDAVMNKKSGLLGVSGISNDSRDVEDAAEEGNERAELAVNIFCHRVKKYIGAYAAVMGGLDLVVFTAGIGENSHIVRERSTQGLEFLGIQIDKEKNSVRGKLKDISSPEARTRVYVVPTDEEFVIARDTLELINNA